MKALLKTMMAFSCLLVFFACKKNDAPAPLKTYLSKTVNSVLGTYTYTYDAQGRLKTETYSGNASNPGRTTTYTSYDAQGRLTEANTQYISAVYPDLKEVTSYNAQGKQSSSYYYESGSSVFVNYVTFEYAANVITWKVYNSSSALTGYVEYTRSNDGKNVIEYRSFSATGGLLFTHYYTFDTQKSIDGLFPVGYKGAPESANNWLTFTKVQGATTTNFTFVYIYNSDGYVTKRTASTGATLEYQYIKQ